MDEMSRGCGDSTASLLLCFAIKEKTEINKKIQLIVSKSLSAYIVCTVYHSHSHTLYTIGVMPE